MKLSPEKLPAALEQAMAPIYLVGGDEPLLVEEAADTVRAAARQAGFNERRVMFAEPGFDWSALASELASGSLFGDRRLVELRVPGGKPGEIGARYLQTYATDPAPDVVLLVLCGMLDASARGSKWYQALERAGVAVQVWPVRAAELPAWIRGRLGRLRLRIEPEALDLLVDRTEGNLLATHQALAQVALLAGGDQVDEATVLATVGHQARFDVQTLAEAAVAGNALRTRRILFGLREEGLEAPLLLWALMRELRLLAGLSKDGALPGGLPPQRRRALEQGRRRAPRDHWRQLLVGGVRLDLLAKGLIPGALWTELVDWTHIIARPYRPERPEAAAGQ
ncbi:MAG: DNA polymerase III subunit delta [Pseudomonadota bacterium]|nr:DNA polymerase III subunit delta [Pseudomonadota bacterium]